MEAEEQRKRLNRERNKESVKKTRAKKKELKRILEERLEETSRINNQLQHKNNKLETILREMINYMDQAINSTLQQQAIAAIQKYRHHLPQRIFQEERPIPSVPQYLDGLAQQLTAAWEEFQPMRESTPTWETMTAEVSAGPVLEEEARFNVPVFVTEPIVQSSSQVEPSIEQLNADVEVWIQEARESQVEFDPDTDLLVEFGLTTQQKRDELVDYIGQIDPIPADLQEVQKIKQIEDDLKASVSYFPEPMEAPFAASVHEKTSIPVLDTINYGLMSQNYQTDFVNLDYSRNYQNTFFYT